MAVSILRTFSTRFGWAYLERLFCAVPSRGLYMYSPAGVVFAAAAERIERCICLRLCWPFCRTIEYVATVIGVLPSGSP